MRAVVQRVLQAEVTVDGQDVALIGRGLLVLLGVGAEDTQQDVNYIAAKIAGLRIFDDKQGKMNLSLGEVGGQVLLVSQFTLYGDCRKGRRPSFTDAAEPARAESLYLAVARELQERGIPVKTGRFGALMQVQLVNDGPVTLLLESAAGA